jgi:alpha-glucosidase
MQGWQQSVVYEIVLISVQDHDGDGKGDLPGLIERVDYLSWLGIGAVWLTPVFTSPMLDLGYDIADFCDIDPIFGPLADFDRLVEALHQRDIRLILDFVPNHSSDQHPWFLQSRSSRSNILERNIHITRTLMFVLRGRIWHFVPTTKARSLRWHLPLQP